MRHAHLPDFHSNRRGRLNRRVRRLHHLRSEAPAAVLNAGLESAPYVTVDETIVVSDGAGQFREGQACGVLGSRRTPRLQAHPANDIQRNAVAIARRMIGGSIAP